MCKLINDMENKYHINNKLIVDYKPETLIPHKIELTLFLLISVSIPKLLKLRKD